MGVSIPTFQAQPQFTETVTLGGDRYELTFTWRTRCNAWYLDLYTLGGSPVWTGRRLSPGFDALFGGLPASVPAGHLFVRGDDPYTREMLGDRVVPTFYLTSEIPIPTPSTPLIITAFP